MKVTQGANHVLESGGLQTSTGFKIKANAHAFRMLSSGLYSDKVSAVLREIGCNGHDAHIAAGRPSQPLDVKLPNNIDPQFYIRDYGIGLSDSEVKNLYTTYFESTKQESDEFTGAFGLGSKSPFSYTDSFTVTACKEGKKRIYSAHIDNKTGSPGIAMMSETDVDPDWPTGVQVSFPVKPQDFSEFANKAQTIFQYFGVVPKIIGSVAVKPIEYEVNRADYGFLKSPETRNYSARSIIALMGNVCYPLDTSKVGLPAYYTRAASFIDNAKDLEGLVLKFRIGDLQVAASREQLQYDPDTVKTIKERLEKVLQSIADEVEFEFNKVNTWDETIDFIALGKRLLRGIASPTDFLTGAKIPKAKVIADTITRSLFKLPDFTDDKTYMRVLSKDDRAATFRLAIRMPPSKGSSVMLEYKKDLTIVSGSEERGQSRVREALRKGDLTGRVILIATNDKLSGTQADVDIVTTKVKSFLKGVDIKPLADYSPPPTVRVSKRKGVSAFPDEKVMLDGKLTKISNIPADRRIYVETTTRVSINSTRTYWYNKEQSLDSHRRGQIEYYCQHLSKGSLGIKLPMPIELHKRDVKRFKMAARTDWKEYFTYLTETLSDPKVMARLEALSKQNKYIVSYEYRGAGEHGILENMVWLKAKRNAVYNTITNVLKKHGIYDTIEAVHSDSTGVSATPSSEPPELANFRALVSQLGLTITTPVYTKMTLSINDRFKAASSVPMHFFGDLAAWDASSFITFVDNQLQKG